MRWNAPIFSNWLVKVINQISLLVYYFFFTQVNDWFDCLNIRVPYKDGRKRLHGLGLAQDVQFSIIDQMTDTMLEMRVKGKQSLLPFQKGLNLNIVLVIFLH